MTPPKTKAASWGAKAAFKTTLTKNDFKPFSSTNQCSISRNLLPTPFYYYKKMFPSIISESKWVNVCCCFHKDKNPSLSLNLKSGGFNFFPYDAKGDDLIAFHRKKFNLGFRDAVLELKKLGEGN